MNAVTNNFLMPMPSRKPRVTVLLTEELREDIELLATEQHRTLSQMSFLLLTDAIKQLKDTGKLSDRTNKGAKN